MTEHIDIAVRAYTQPITGGEPTPRTRGRRQKDWRPLYVLVFDTETTTDRTQRLLLGCYRLYGTSWRTSGPKLKCLEEGLFYADELPEADPAGYEVLRDYVLAHPPATDPRLPGWSTSIHLRLMSRGEFVERFDKVARRARGTVVGFNLPFDLSRVSVSCRDARGGRFAGGFSLGLATYTDHQGIARPNPHRPAVAIKTIDSKRSLIGLTAPLNADPTDRIPDGASNGKPQRGYAFRGHFLDLRTLTFALTDRGHTLESACDTFNVPYTKREVKHGHITGDYITYCREDVQATADLYTAAISEYVRHPILLQPTKAYSPASIGKSYLKEMGVRPPLERQPDFPRDALGHAMAAYYGGRAECRIRRVPVPVVYCDFLAMYSTVCALLGLWRLLTSTSVRVVEHNPAQLDELTPGHLLDPGSWPGLVGLAQIAPDGDVLPVRGRYDGRNFGIGLNPLHVGEPMWYALPDVYASALLTGHAPKVLRHIRFEPGRKARTLRPVRLRGNVEIDPRKDDFIKTLVEQRKTLRRHIGIQKAERERLDRFLKVLGNSTNYGIYAEMNRSEQPGKQRGEVAVYGLGQFTSRTATPELAGGYFFSPYACVIASGARMMLALLERLVTDHGGSYAFCDTDSMGIVSTHAGGLIPCPGGPHLLDGRPAIRALSRQQTNRIVEQFQSLNPYDPDALPGSVLEIEKENFDTETGKHKQLHCQAISAKRYVLYNTDQSGNTIVRMDIWADPDDPDANDPDGRPICVGGLRKRSEHGLGHLVNPTDPDDESRDWITRAWEDETRLLLGIPTGPEPDWLDRPALTRTTISTPGLRRAFNALNDRRSYPDQVKPFNFLLVAHVAPLGHPTGTDPNRFLLVTPYNPDGRQWKKLRWTNPYQPGSSYRITTTAQPTDRVVRVKTYREVLAEYRTHAEPKSLGPDGQPCDRETVGLLKRRPVRASTITHIGKEANRLEDRQAGLVRHEGEVLNDYRDRARDPFDQLVRPVLSERSVAEIATVTDLSTRTIKRARAASGSPLQSTRKALTEFAAEYAHAELRAAGISPPRESLAAIAAYLDQRRDRGLGTCLRCGSPLNGRQTRWCSEACRKGAARAAA